MCDLEQKTVLLNPIHSDYSLSPNSPVVSLPLKLWQLGL